MKDQKKKIINLKYKMKDQKKTKIIIEIKLALLRK